ncbi:N-6 DNA methylase [Serratia marcescens]|uniref:N-6 DNA methylase n=1 Tax=Serratia marcescens TaxID=615 RepID=UPI003EDA48CF
MSQLSFDALFSVPVDVVRPAEKNVRADALEQPKIADPVPGRKRTITGDDPRKAFLSTFRETARYHHRYEVFSDFVKLTACALENLLLKSPDIEAEYLATIQRYEKADQQRMAQLYSWLIIGLDQGMGDFLGSLFMELGSGNIGQFFTPFHLSELMAGLVAGDRLAALENEPYITLSEPTCGAGGMVIAFAKVMLARGYNPQTQLRADCVDIDPVAARMCYIQLSLLGIPARVVIGNSLTLKYQREMYTPFWYRVTSKRWPMYR